MNRPVTTEDILLYILAVFLPPAPVFIKRGCGGQVCLNILLCFLGGIPGIIHAFYIIYKGDKVPRSTYVYHDPNQSGYQNHPPPPQHGSHSYQGNGQAPPPPQQGYGQQGSYYPPAQPHVQGGQYKA